MFPRCLLPYGVKIYNGSIQIYIVIQAIVSAISPGAILFQARRAITRSPIYFPAKMMTLSQGAVHNWVWVVACGCRNQSFRRQIKNWSLYYFWTVYRYMIGECDYARHWILIVEKIVPTDSYARKVKSFTELTIVNCTIQFTLLYFALVNPNGLYFTTSVHSKAPT